MKDIFIDVVLFLSIPRLFTYKLQKEDEAHIEIGKRVLVPFGRSKIRAAVILNIHNNPPKSYSAKDILGILDDEPILTAIQIKYFKWISEYYMANLGEVYSAALPTGFKINSESILKLVENSSEDLSKLDKNALLLIKEISTKKKVTINTAKKILPTGSVNNIVKKLFDKNIIQVLESPTELFKPKIEKYITLHPIYLSDSEKLTELFDILKGRELQTNVLLAYLKHIPILNNQRKLSNEDALLKKSILLMENISKSSLKSLISKDILLEYDKIVSRINPYQKLIDKPPELTPHQNNALQSIYTQFESNNVILLQGVTGSGKTEIYIKLISEAIKSGGQVLYLLPEIALTDHIIKRLGKIFGKEILVYHSKYTSLERVEVWYHILFKKSSIILGTRSAVFLPFDNLSLIILDEEHDPSYKQNDPSPRYFARDAAIMLAKMHNAKVVLGSATPSIESYYNTQIGKYGLVQLNERYGGFSMPEIKVQYINTKDFHKNFFSSNLVDKIKENIEKRGQTIVFQNLRGYSPYMICSDCEWVAECQNCSVSMTYHKYNSRLCCHYCGTKIKIFKECKICGSTHLLIKGYGTERIDEVISSLIENAIVKRIDLETTRTKNSFDNIITQFEEGNIDILIGTQMISKGFDFHNVQLVCIPHFDRMLSIPNFRAFERCFQLTTQVIGRAGRKDSNSNVIIQTSNLKNKILNNIVNNEFENFYKTEILDRKTFHYPPFYRIIKIILKHKSKQNLQKTGIMLSTQLQKSIPYEVSKSFPPNISKINTEYIENILIKIPYGAKNLKSIKKTIYEISRYIISSNIVKPVKIKYDVDPQ